MRKVENKKWLEEEDIHEGQRHLHLTVQ